MAKRVRGTVRPGRRRAANRPQPRPNTLREATAPAPSPERRTGGLTAEEERRAAEIEARIVEQERSVEETRRRRDTRERLAGDERPRTAQAGGLAAEASQEYAYVVRDVRRIVLIGGGLVGILFVLFILIDVTHILTI
ncbi:MAG TPA: hypothetical protein VFS32_10735 [Candidatus Limnocylindrales bacterium]|nr:hypothetical protein [Candidatus Limnocylindrales bacterium]